MRSKARPGSNQFAASVQEAGLGPVFRSGVHATRRLWLPILVVCAISSIVFGCGTQEHFFDVTGDLYVVSASQHYDGVLERATTWMADAALVRISAGVRSANTPRPGPSLTFMFGAPSAPNSYYALDLEKDGWFSRVVEVGSGAAVPPPIQRDEWSVDSVDAWSIALANGVEGFLAHYQDPTTMMDVTLDYWRTRTGQEVLAWRVICSILRGPGLYILIDPKTGDIIEVEERSTSGTLVATTPTLPATPWPTLPACTPATPEPGLATGLPERIAFSSSRDGPYQIYLMDPGGSNIVQLTDGPGAHSDARWSPDGQRIAFTSTADLNIDIYVVDADRANLQRLTDHPAYDREPTWSPDGSRIAFSSDRDGNYNIYVMDADGSNLALLTDHPLGDDSPDWSPDGCRIAFVSDRDHWPEAHIYVVDVDGSNLTQLTDGSTLDYGPRWSPDGAKIAFWSQPIDQAEAQPNVYVMDQDGSHKAQLTHGPCGGYAPVWSPDGTRIVFSIGRDDPFGSDIFLMDADGTDVVQVTYDPESNSPCSWRW